MNDSDIINSIRTTINSHLMAGVGFIAGTKKDIFVNVHKNIEDRWEKLKSRCFNCRMCSLSNTRTNVVFGDGNTKARIVFIGEAPGEDEDIQGKPFVGKAGQLLSKMIEAMGLKRTDVYICNVLKCRPPLNRPPQPDEILSCRKYLDEQIALISPKVICTLGKYAGQTVLNTTQGITIFRGNSCVYKSIPVIPTYHPAYLLRNPSAKKIVWEDLQKAMKILEQG